MGNLCDVGLSGDVSDPGGAPDILLPHQDAQFVQHIAMDIGGSLIKLVYFSSGDDDDGASSEALGSEECDCSHPRAPDNHNCSSNTQRPSSPPVQAPHPSLRTEQQQQSLDTQPRQAELAHEPAEHHSSTDPNHSTAKVTFTASSASSTRNGLQSYPIATSCDALQDSAHTLPARPSGDADVPDSPVGLDATDPVQQDSMSTSSEKGRQGGRLHFVKFESARVHDAINFIEQKQLHCRRNRCSSDSRPLFQVHVLIPPLLWFCF